MQITKRLLVVTPKGQMHCHKSATVNNGLEELCQLTCLQTQAIFYMFVHLQHGIETCNFENRGINEQHSAIPVFATGGQCRLNERLPEL